MKILIYNFFFLLFISFLSCNKETNEIDPCEGISCINNGNCVNGQCICPVEWAGPDCSQEKVPDKMRVGKIEITSFPVTDINGSSWDLLDGADVYLVISKNNINEYESNFIEDLTSNHEWVTNFEFSDPTATYSISVYDYDDGFSSDDFLGGINFTPYLQGQRFPEELIIDCGNCVVSFEFKDISYFHS